MGMRFLVTEKSSFLKTPMGVVFISRSIFSTYGKLIGSNPIRGASKMIKPLYCYSVSVFFVNSFPTLDNGTSRK